VRTEKYEEEAGELIDKCFIHSGNVF